MGGSNVAAKGKRQQRSQRCKITVVGEIDPYALLAARLTLLGIPTEEAKARALRLKRGREGREQQTVKHLRRNVIINFT
ncbi:MAG TPA: hypothetical protein VIQ24_24260 [Pyrinomonadaceae bacterium]